MGTGVEILLPEERAATGGAVRGLFVEWERRLSRFLPESELSLLNGSAGAPVAVSPLLERVLARALAAAEATGGIYDPTLLEQLRALGYDRSFTELSGAPTMPAAAPRADGGWRRIRLDRSRRRVVLPAGVGLDLGGIAKGMAVDAALELLRARGVETALVSAGGDLAVLGQPPGFAGWPIAVGGREGSWTVLLRGGAIATSSVARRRWRQDGRECHHLVDPRTGEPAASGLWSVSVAAARCDQAEVAAKTALILGRIEGRAMLVRHGLAALMVPDSGDAETVGGWPPPPERLA
ncbi:MAG: FAD:protein transferase [Miltoncostaeaceae bacterium]|nr:FAD:protein transferase [Miltoncostaeaceae bacterium]